MNVTYFLHILQKSNTTLSPQKTRELGDIISEYPYFQAARALHLKGLKNLDSYKYNNALKVTAAHTTDRDVLFGYITSNNFVQNNIDNETPELREKKKISEEIKPNPYTKTIFGRSKENPLPQNIQHAEQILDPKLFTSKEPRPKARELEQKKPLPENELDLGNPIPFTKTEKHSFAEWLQLTAKNNFGETDHRDPEEANKKRKFALLDKFIENNPKIVPKQHIKETVDIEESVKLDKSELMTETLAKVYLEQKKYKKAIRAFKILSLKYPEKSGFFANQILAVKKLQKEKE